MMALTEDMHDLVRKVADALSKHEMQTLGGAPPITGHGYYDPGAVATTAVLAWLMSHGDAWTREQLLGLVTEMVHAMTRKEWAHLEGGSPHGG